MPRKECMWIRRSLLSTSVRRHRNPSLDWPQRHNEELGRNPGVHCLWASRFNSARLDGHHSTRFTSIRITPFPVCMAFFVEMSCKNLNPKYNSFFLSFSLSFSFPSLFLSLLLCLTPFEYLEYLTTCTIHLHALGFPSLFSSACKSPVVFE